MLLHSVGVSGYESSRNSLGTSSLRFDKSGRVVIQLRTFRGPEDRRFWIAHEIAHLLWRDPRNLQRSLSHAELQIGADPTIEWLCNRYAAALLVPKSKIGRYFDLEATPTGAALTRLPSLAKRLRIPQRLLARRYFHDLDRRSVAVLSLKPSPITGSKNGSAEIEWEAVPKVRLSKQKKLGGRTVPKDMLPLSDVDEAGVDGRWNDLIRSTSLQQRASNLANIQSKPGGAVATARWIESVERRLIVAISV
jgi:Zn-dependent peptidase ImmA (M78 family)